MAMTQEQLMAIVEAVVQQRLAAAGFCGGTNDRAGGFGRRRIQEKDFRRVDKFSGGEDDWKAWEFDFKVSARAADAILVEAVEVAEIESKDITAADFSELEDQKWDGLEDKSGQLYDILCMLTSGEAKSVIREVPGGDGTTALQALAKSHARRFLARVLRRSREVMNPVSAKDLSEVVGVIARWETQWKELERTEGVRLPDMVKMAALTELCPPDIRDLIFQTVDSGLTFDTMKEKVISWASNKVASRKEMPVPMDIGRLKDVQDWDDQTQEEEWHEVGAVGDSCHRCGGVVHYARECPTAKGKGKGKGKGRSKGKGVDGARAERWQWPGKGKSMGKGESKTGLPGQCYGCSEYGHRVASCPKWKTFAIEQNGEVEAQEETVQVASVYWDVGCVEVKPKIKMTNRFAVLEEEDDCKMAHPPGLTGTCDKRLEVTVDSGAEESVWPAKLLQEIPTVRKKFLVANGQEMGHYGRKKIKFGGETGSVKTMSFEVTDVTKPLVAVRRIMEKGNEVHFGKECYIRNVHTGERIPMRRKGGSYVIDIDVNIDEESFTRQT